MLGKGFTGGVAIFGPGCLHVRTCDEPAGCGPAHSEGMMSRWGPLRLCIRHLF